jgi:hypothetical protein
MITSRPRRTDMSTSRQRAGLRERDLARAHGGLAPLTPILSAAPSHRERTLMLYAALALGLLSVAGLSLLRMLRQLGQFSGLTHEGPMP